MIKVFHIGSGLGNQMLDYADMLASRSVNPSDQYYIETIDYDVEQDKISMWNGYELEKIFNIKEHNIKEHFSEEQWSEIMDEVNQSEFWNHGWNYPDTFIRAFSNQGLDLVNQNNKTYGVAEGICTETQMIRKEKYIIKRLLFKLLPAYFIKQTTEPSKVYKTTNTNDFDGSYRIFKYKNNGIERIEKDLRRAFVFPEYDEKNKEFSRFLKSKNSIAIHARRGDLLGANGYCYEYGFFKRATAYLRKKTPDPVFVFFCDSGSVEWSRQNPSIFGLDFNKDEVYFADWNKGSDSYRDMQLMTDCKHAIITESTFGWWGAFLNNNPQKITISPDVRINTTNWL